MYDLSLDDLRRDFPSFFSYRDSNHDSLPTLYERVTRKKDGRIFYNPTGPSVSRLSERPRLFVKNYREKADLLVYEPSTSASVESLKGWGGAREFVRAELLKEQGIEESVAGKPDYHDGVRFTDFDPVSFAQMGIISYPVEYPPKDFVTLPATVKKPTDRLFSEHHFRNRVSTTLQEIPLYRMVETRPGVVVSVHSSVPEVNRRIVNDFFVDRYQPGRTVAKVSAVLEPLKVRLITKTEAALAWFCQPIRVDLYNSIKTLPSLVLTTRPLNIMDLYAVMDRERSIDLTSMGFPSRGVQNFRTTKLGSDLPPRSLFELFENDPTLGWVSGDYSAATDGLDMNITKMILEDYLDHRNYSEEEKIASRQILYSQELTYPSQFNEELQAFADKNKIPNFLSRAHPHNIAINQMNGQLMGSILSFPVLCIANLLVYWNSLRLWLWSVYSDEMMPRNWCPDWLTLRSLPVLVNGDDILFRSTTGLYKIWNVQIGIAGFKLSIGKNYFSPFYLTINSECFRIIHHPSLSTQGPMTWRFEKIEYTKVGLLMGRSKLKKDAKDVSPTDLVSVGRDQFLMQPVADQYNDVMRGAFDPLRAHKRFMHYHIRLITKMTGGDLDFGRKGGFYSLFARTSLLGFGFDPPKGLDNLHSFTNSQLKIAAHFYNEFLKNVASRAIPISKTHTLVPSTAFVDVKSQDLERYPSSGGHFVTIQQTEGLGPLEELQQHFGSDPEPPLLFGATRTDKTEYQLKLPPTRVMRKVIRKEKAKHTDKLLQLLLEFRPNTLKVSGKIQVSPMDYNHVILESEDQMTLPDSLSMESENNSSLGPNDMFWE